MVGRETDELWEEKESLSVKVMGEVDGIEEKKGV